MTNKEFKWIRWGLLLTQKQLAEVLGYRHKIRVSEYERETNPAPIPDHIATIMRGLRVSRDEPDYVGAVRPWGRLPMTEYELILPGQSLNGDTEEAVPPHVIEWFLDQMRKARGEGYASARLASYVPVDKETGKRAWPRAPYGDYPMNTIMKPNPIIDNKERREIVLRAMIDAAREELVRWEDKLRRGKA